MVRRLHRALVEHYFYPLLLSTLLAIGLFAGRVIMYHTFVFRFLVWNLVLAWLPYVWGLWAVSLHRRYPRRWWALIIPAVLWLLFFPNAPYLVTDFLHLYEKPPVPLWYDIGLLTSFAWAGCFLAVTSLGMMHRIVRDYTNRPIGWLFVFGVVGLSGLGVYMGRFLRWNSWDLLLYPHDVLTDIGYRLIHPLSHLQTYGVTLMFGAFILVCYGMFAAIQHRESH